MSSKPIAELARSLDAAWATASAIPAPTTVHPNLTIADAYAIQDLIIASRTNAGRRVAGWKLGLTSAPPPAVPIAGTLLDDMVLPSGTRLRTDTMVAPMVEGELVVEIGADLDGPTSPERLLEGPHRIAGGIEVIDYRTNDSAGEVDWVADNSTVAYAVVGPFHALSEFDPAAIEVSLYRDEDSVATGRGDLVMGNPLVAVAWLSEHLATRGRRLEEGQIVLTGSLTKHHPVPHGSPLFRADFGELGVVSVAFED